MSRYWISWYEPIDSSGDYRPHDWPLPDSIPAYWCSGHLGNGSAATLCAVVDAPSANAAQEEIRKYWNPGEWRFAYTKPHDWRPQADRFPWPVRDEKTAKEGDQFRRMVYDTARAAYNDPDFFPEKYEDARSDSGKSLGDGLARFIAVEIWEVMEGQHTLRGCRDEAVLALSNAQEDMQQIIDALQDM